MINQYIVPKKYYDLVCAWSRPKRRVMINKLYINGEEEVVLGVSNELVLKIINEFKYYSSGVATHDHKKKVINDLASSHELPHRLIKFVVMSEGLWDEV